MPESPDERITKAKLRSRIVRSLRAQGFRIRNGSIFPPEILSKQTIRELNQIAVTHRVAQARRGLLRKEAVLLSHFASGNDVIPEKISPRLVEVTPKSKEELLFRYASLHWSIPVSSGYGRRLRFLVVDENNAKIMGLIGLGDPIFSLRPRDEWIDWTSQERKRRLRNVMDAFVLGAVPPYSFLMCGKLISMLATSDTVRIAFKNKYDGARSIIKGQKHDGRLALITTASALGRSSIYNRLKLLDRTLYQSVGFTKGSGEFHFINGLYTDIFKFAQQNCHPTAKQVKWGIGFRNRREIVRKCLPVLGLSSSWVYHGIEREVFMVPLARNTREFLRGEHEHLIWYHQAEPEIFDYFSRRWMLPRAARDDRFKTWNNDQWALWPTKRNSCY